MAHDNPGKTISLPAAADLSTHQYKAVKVDGNGRAALCGADERAVGILQNDPDAIDKMATVMVDGVSKCIMSGNIAPGTVVASDANGKVKAPAALSNTLGVVLDNGGADNAVGSLLVQISHLAAS